MDGDSKKLRVRFSGVGKGGRGGRQGSAIPPQESRPIGIAEMNSSGEYDAAFAATIAAAAFAIAAREDKLAAQKNSVPIEEVTPSLSPVNRAEGTKKPAGGNKIARWFSGKEPIEHDDDDEGPVNVSVRRPLKPAPGKPEDVPADHHKVAPRMLETSLGVRKGSGSSSRSAERKWSKEFEQEQAVQKAPSAVRPATSYRSGRNGEGAAGVAATGGTGSKADEWEKAKLGRVREEYEKMMETIAEWETEKKTELDRKREKALEEYNLEMTRISKISGGARAMAEERKYNDRKKIREKARKMRSTGKPPRTCACF
ncbi:remorin6.3 isoform X3 [Zea mays]|nr:remorin6.3 isoform X3 [Zea mays]|eukprot:XP_008671213.1 remorin6.3 isoform X3 [Zea mays]